MQSIKITFLSILLAHLLGNFVLQPGRIEPAGNRYRAYLERGFIHFILLLGCLFFTYDGLFKWRAQLLLAAYVCALFALDYFQRFLFKRWSISGTLKFAAQQLLHLVIIGFVVCLLNNINWKQFAGQFSIPMEVKQKILAIVVVYTATMFAGGYLIRHLTLSILPGTEPESAESPKELVNAGLYIGWLERFLVLSAVIMQSPALVGLILTGKSIARFPELKEEHFAEYFLIGTLLSVSIAVMGGFVLNRMIYGAVSLK